MCFVIHLPPAFETEGLEGKQLERGLHDLGRPLGQLLFSGYLIGTVRVDTGGGLPLASRNAWGALGDPGD